MICVESSATPQPANQPAQSTYTISQTPTAVADTSSSGKQLGGGLAKTAIIGDFDNNSCVEFADFTMFAQAYGTVSIAKSQFDLDGSGTVDFADFLIFSKEFNSETNKKICNEVMQKLLTGSSGGQA